MNKFQQKGRVEVEEEPLSQMRVLICSEGNLWVGMLFGVGLTCAFDFGVG